MKKIMYPWKSSNFISQYYCTNFSFVQTAHLQAMRRIIISKLFFFVLCCVRHRNSGEGPSLLSPGIHSFPFKLGLPLGLPSTFLGKHGWVQYYCKAALREPGGLTHKNQQVFIVMNPIDLNLEPPILAVSFSLSVSMFQSLHYGWFCILYLYILLLKNNRVE